MHVYFLYYHHSHKGRPCATRTTAENASFQIFAFVFMKTQQKSPFASENIAGPWESSYCFCVLECDQKSVQYFYLNNY